MFSGSHRGHERVAGVSLLLVLLLAGCGHRDSGTGTGAPAYQVTLAWNGAASPVAGYYVYRAETSGGPYAKLNSTLDAQAAYTDVTVQAGRTYFYVVTAVTAGGVESEYSSETSAVIPPS